MTSTFGFNLKTARPKAHPSTLLSVFVIFIDDDAEQPTATYLVIIKLIFSEAVAT